MEMASVATWVKAFLGWPKGFGDKRIEACLSLEPDVSKWTALEKVPKGQSPEAFAEVQAKVSAYIDWRAIFPASNVTATTAAPAVSVEIKGYYVLSGFRDSDLQTKLASAGWVLHDRITKTTTVLLVPDEANETTKVKAAREAGVRIVPRSAANTLF